MNLDNLLYVKYPRILPIFSLKSLSDILSNNSACVFEKIDGGNSQVRKVSNWQVIGGTRANFVKGKLAKNGWFSRFNRWVYSNRSLINLPENLIMFGEWAGNHTIDYGTNNDQFYFFDLFDLATNRFIEYSKSLQILKSSSVTGFESLPPLAYGKVKIEEVQDLLFSKSSLRDGPKEGLVIKFYNSRDQPFFKLYHPNYAEVIVDDSGKINYLTPTRFRKSYFLLLENETDFTQKRLVELVRANISSEHGINYSRAQVSKVLGNYISSGVLDLGNLKNQRLHQ